MAELTDLYQTIRNTDNPDTIEQQGAIKSERGTWLGPGYYFWEDSKPMAKWWGETHYQNNYMICKAAVSVDDNMLLDLMWNKKDRKTFLTIVNDFQLRNKNKEIRFIDIYNFLVKRNLFRFKVLIIPTRSCGNYPSTTIRFSPENKSWYEIDPPVQVCVYDKSLIKDYHIIYPPEYVQGTMT